jgi:caffeoyl-CoA O-methyltransferase
MPLPTNNIELFCERHTSPMTNYLAKIERETHLRSTTPQMLSGALLGKFLEMISHLATPTRVLEIGTFSGFSACCLAAGLTEHGHLHTIEVDEERAFFSKKNIENTPFFQKITVHAGDATKIIPTIREIFDLVFIDAGKLDSWQHFELSIEKTRIGGFILVDNIFWSGKIFEATFSDKTTVALRDFCEKIQADARVENVLLPLRDGLFLMRKVQ